MQDGGKPSQVQFSQQLERLLAGDRSLPDLDALRPSAALILDTVHRALEDPSVLDALASPEDTAPGSPDAETAHTPALGGLSAEESERLQQAITPHIPLILAVAATTAQPAMRPMLEQNLDQLAEQGWTQRVDVLRRVLDGERDADTLGALAEHAPKPA
jgi:hypothetical protein